MAGKKKYSHYEKRYEKQYTRFTNTTSCKETKLAVGNNLKARQNTENIGATRGAAAGSNLPFGVIQLANRPSGALWDQLIN